MTNAATFLPMLLCLYCYGNGLIGGLLTGHSTQAHIPETTADHQERHSADNQAHFGSKSSAKSPRSSCKPLGSFLACYDVDVPVFPSHILGASDRPVEVPVSMTALGRRFRLRLHVDDLSGKSQSDGLKREMAWSSVMSSSTIVRMVGDSDNSVREYHLYELGISWYVGNDDFEVAPSSVLASMVDVNDTQVFHAVIHTTSDVYYVQPASDYPEVKSAFTNDAF